MRLAVVLACLAACGDDVRGSVTIVTSSWVGPLREYAALTPGELVAVDDLDPLPSADAPGFQIGVVDDPALPAEGYRIDPVAGAARSWIVHAHDALGAQYGVSDALEHLGFRFRHPYDPYVPAGAALRSPPDGIVHAPQTRVRGFQLHTLHPIESFFAFWAGDRDDAHRIIDWVIKNRGNYLQWVALDDILDPQRRAEWQAFTRELIDYAHGRGIRVGINIQLFSQSSLQQALTLVNDSTTPVDDQIAANLPVVVDGLPWDVYSLSFGEFFDADPQAFIDAVNQVALQLKVAAPGAEMHAVVHVGGTQLVTYMGQTLIYYFLVQFVDPSVIPDIHTVMYYDLFESAGGAYQMMDFSPHRTYLLQKMCASQKAAYFPETAYWIAFDDSVPTFLPLYVRTRLYDLAQLRAAAPPPCGPLDEQLIFSSGWEWGYWLNDVAALRASYELPDSQQALIADQLAPDLGEAAATVVSDLADLEHDALIGQGLAAYFASRDALIDAGRALGVISQPDRMTFDDLVAAPPDQVAAFQTSVMAPLGDFADALDVIEHRSERLHLPPDRWASELRDGIAIDRARAHFIWAAYQAVLAHLAGDDAGAEQSRADASAWLDQAAMIVAHRDADLHDPHREILQRALNATVYPFGYLYQADVLCYWHRELDQVDAVLGNSDLTPPSCVF
ncbi:MAG TPA: hypothetical protein VLX92_26525 [Kofleriaceae bacterium]|nr:hypothetical protein [Kofleriaceae bacterium]